jgi:hypothetical protein
VRRPVTTQQTVTLLQEAVADLRRLDDIDIECEPMGISATNRAAGF